MKRSTVAWVLLVSHGAAAIVTALFVYGPMPYRMSIVSGLMAAILGPVAVPMFCSENIPQWLLLSSVNLLPLSLIVIALIRKSRLTTAAACAAGGAMILGAALLLSRGSLPAMMD